MDKEEISERPRPSQSEIDEYMVFWGEGNPEQLSPKECKDRKIPDYRRDVYVIKRAGPRNGEFAGWGNLGNHDWLDCVTRPDGRINRSNLHYRDPDKTFNMVTEGSLFGHVSRPGVTGEVTKLI